MSNSRTIEKGLAEFFQLPEHQQAALCAIVNKGLEVVLSTPNHLLQKGAATRLVGQPLMQQKDHLR